MKRTFDYTVGASRQQAPTGVSYDLKPLEIPAALGYRPPAEEVQPTVMPEWIDRRTGIWTGVAVLFGVGFFLALELREEPDMSALDIALELVEIIPLVLVIVGMVLLARVAARQRDDQLTLIRDLEVARIQGERWRSETRTIINGLGEAIDAQFSRWNLTEAEREVALLLLKGLSIKEVGAVRATSERTIRAQARALYTKAGVTGRAALSAFFLEDLLAPMGRSPE